MELPGFALGRFLILREKAAEEKPYSNRQCPTEKGVGEISRVVGFEMENPQRPSPQRVGGT